MSSSLPEPIGNDERFASQQLSIHTAESTNSQMRESDKQDSSIDLNKLNILSSLGSSSSLPRSVASRSSSRRSRAFTTGTQSISLLEDRKDLEIVGDQLKDLQVLCQSFWALNDLPIVRPNEADLINVSENLDFKNLDLENDKIVSYLFDLLDLKSDGMIDPGCLIHLLSSMTKALKQRNSPCKFNDEEEVIAVVNQWFQEIYDEGQFAIDRSRFPSWVKNHQDVIEFVAIINQMDIQVSKEVHIWSDTSTHAQVIYDGSSGEVTAGTVNQLIERLTNGNIIDMNPSKKTLVYYSSIGKKFGKSFDSPKLKKEKNSLRSRSLSRTMLRSTTVSSDMKYALGERDKSVDSFVSFSPSVKRRSIFSKISDDSRSQTPTQPRRGLKGMEQETAAKDVATNADFSRRRGGVQHLTELNFSESPNNSNLSVMKISETVEDYEVYFFLTYGTFTTPEILLRKLIQRFEVPSYVEWKLAKFIKFQVIQVLRRWMNTFPRDFTPEMIETVRTFLLEASESTCTHLPHVQRIILGISNEIDYKKYYFIPDMVSTIPLQNIKSNLHYYINCFSGKSVMEWIENNLHESKNPAMSVKIFKDLIQAGFIRHIHSLEVRHEEDHYYHFAEDLNDQPQIIDPSFSSLLSLLEAKHDKLAIYKKNPTSVIPLSYAAETFLRNAEEFSNHFILLYELHWVRKKEDNVNEAKALYSAYLEPKEFGKMNDFKLPAINSSLILQCTTDIYKNKFGTELFKNLYDVLFDMIQTKVWPKFYGSPEYLLLLKNKGMNPAWDRVKLRKEPIGRFDGNLDLEAREKWSKSFPVPKLPKAGLTEVIKFNAHKVRDKETNQIVPGTTFDDLDELEIARQLTLIAHENLQKIDRNEFLNQAWSKPSMQHLSTNLINFIDRFNAESVWVAYMILECSDLKARVKVMEKFIKIAKHLQELKNFSTLMAFYAAFNNASISRLKLTRNLLNKQSNLILMELETFFDPKSNYRNYREAFQTCEELQIPAIPYLGLFLTDLTFIDDGNSKKIGGLINFVQRIQTAKVLLQILSCQERLYPLTPVPSILSHLQNLPFSTKERLYSLSMSIEPRISEH